MKFKGIKDDKIHLEIDLEIRSEIDLDCFMSWWVFC